MTVTATPPQHKPEKDKGFFEVLIQSISNAVSVPLEWIRKTNINLAIFSIPVVAIAILGQLGVNFISNWGGGPGDVSPVEPVNAQIKLQHPSRLAFEIKKDDMAKRRPILLKLLTDLKIAIDQAAPDEHGVTFAVALHPEFRTLRVTARKFNWAESGWSIDYRVISTDDWRDAQKIVALDGTHIFGPKRAYTMKIQAELAAGKIGEKVKTTLKEVAGKDDHPATIKLLF